MYSINNIAFETYGITAGRIDGSNIALSGQLDMPARLGKTFHDWTGEEGVEPYVLASEIRHGGRDLVFSGYLVATNKELAYEQLATFYEAVKAHIVLNAHFVVDVTVRTVSWFGRSQKCLKKK